MGIFFLILLAVVFFFWIQTIARWQRLCMRQELVSAQDEFRALCDDHARLQEEIERLKAVLERTIALYDITKRICAYLDEGKVIAAFREEIKKYLGASECALVEGLLTGGPADGGISVPVRIDVQRIGHLIAQGVSAEDKDTFSILAHQFALCTYRCLLYQKVQETAITDALTNVLTRRYFLERCQEELIRSKKFHYTFAFIMIDLDRFKEYNDQYGHLVGDALLKEVARIIKESLRQIDLVGRYGGEEFAVLLTETDSKGAGFAAERIRQAIAASSITAYDERLRITISAGFAVYPAHSQQLAGLIEKADQALYQAKAGGRNRVCSQ
jgi:diguanylate cyclase (GGDEF)-like protein